jgi:hypothetical protein
LYHHGLSEEQFAKVGKIVLNWGAADNFVGYCLNFVFKISDPEDQIDLTLVLDMRKKVDLLVKSAGRKSVSEEKTLLIKELSSVCRLWAEDRNFLAHGLGVASADGDYSIMSGKKQKPYNIDNLDRDIERSAYVLNLAMRLNMLLAGVEWNPLGPLPSRPA